MSRLPSALSFAPGTTGPMLFIQLASLGQNGPPFLKTWMALFYMLTTNSSPRTRFLRGQNTAFCVSSLNLGLPLMPHFVFLSIFQSAAVGLHCYQQSRNERNYDQPPTNANKLLLPNSKKAAPCWWQILMNQSMSVSIIMYFQFIFCKINYSPAWAQEVLTWVCPTLKHVFGWLSAQCMVY